MQASSMHGAPKTHMRICWQVSPAGAPASPPSGAAGLLVLEQAASARAATRRARRPMTSLRIAFTHLSASTPVARARTRVLDDRDELGAVLGVGDEVDVRDVDDEQGALAVAEEELRVGPRDLRDVLGANGLLLGASALSDAL